MLLRRVSGTRAQADPLNQAELGSTVHRWQGVLCLLHLREQDRWIYCREVELAASFFREWCLHR